MLNWKNEGLMYLFVIHVLLINAELVKGKSALTTLEFLHVNVKPKISALGVFRNSNKCFATNVVHGEVFMLAKKKRVEK